MADGRYRVPPATGGSAELRASQAFSVGTEHAEATVETLRMADGRRITFYAERPPG